MDFATLTTAARSWIQPDPAFLQIVRGYFNGSVYLLAQAVLLLFPSCFKTHSLGFAKTEKDMEGMRAAGSQFWGGVLDTHFWFDPTDLMTQVLPFLDDEFIFLYADFERAVYANLGQLKAAIRP